VEDKEEREGIRRRAVGVERSKPPTGSEDHSAGGNLSGTTAELS